MGLRNALCWLGLPWLALSGCTDERFEYYPEAVESVSDDPCAKVKCKAPDACHTAGTCDPDTGECVFEELPDGTTCEDGNACTYSDRCESGQCEGGGEVVCQPLDACHVAGKCDEKSGCSQPKEKDGTPCGDDDACTSEDHCSDGVCVGTPTECPPPEQCYEQGGCNAATGSCTYVPKAAGAACEAGEQKNCSAGRCDGQGACVLAPVTCEAIDTCHEAGVCDPETGACSNPVKDDGESCDDGEICTEGDRCRAGVCSGPNPTTCPAPDDCHLAGSCQTGKGCVYPKAPDNTTCEDGDKCTLSDRCTAGTCTSGAPRVCTAAGPCSMAGTCDSSTGVCDQIALTNGTACVDDNLCTQGTTCVNGTCGGGSAVTCASDDPCRVPIACDAEQGCLTEAAPDGTDCEDDDLCTDGDQCVAGTCRAGAPRVCVAINSCHLAGVCQPDSGLCSVTWVNNGTACDDADLCTNDDACTDGQCQGEAVTCDEPCLLGAVCDPSQGICVGSPVKDGTACDDDSLCATSSVCEQGTCTAKTLLACTALDSCHAAGFCDETSGECTQPTAYAGQACVDGFCFADVTSQAGLTWPHEEGNMPLRATGGFFDADGDGLLDVLFVSEEHGLILFLNAGQGIFEPDHRIPSVTSPTSATAADYDNDGDIDLYVTSTSTAALLRNDGTGVFRNVASTAGVTSSGISVASTFADLDGDGWLDLYVAHQPRPSDSAAAANQLYRNRGDGTFANVTAAAQVAGLGKTMSVVASDVDGDGFADLLVCNDATSGFDGNVVYRNSGSSTAGMTGRFTRENAASLDCLGGAAGDYDRDGDTDYYWAAIGNNALWRNSAAVFSDVAATASVLLAKDACSAQTTASWEAGFYDFDADGWLDLYVSNGGEVPGVGGTAPHSPNALLRNNKNNTFTDVALSAGTADPRLGRGVAFGDYDNDGDVDILQLNALGGPQLLKNQTTTTNGWAALSLRGIESNRGGVGAQVLWTTEAFSRLDERRTASGASGPSDPRLFTGLGSAQQVHAEITWPSGTEQALFYLPRNAVSQVVEPSITITAATLSANSVKRGSAVTANLTLSASASGATYTARLYTSALALHPQTLATATTASTAQLTVTVGASTYTGAATLVVTATDAAGGRDDHMYSVDIAAP